MGRSRSRRLAVPLVVLAGSQLGHAITYFVRFGGAAATRQAVGVHSYYPALAGVLSAVVGGGLMAALAVIAMARLLDASSRRCTCRPTTRVLDVLPVVFAVQLAVFMGQESLEALAAGARVPSAIELLLWGGLGQLPAAAVAAFLVGWLLTWVEAAWTVLVTACVRVVTAPAVPRPRRPARPAPGAAVALASVFPRAFQKRGPPPPLLVPIA